MFIEDVIYDLKQDYGKRFTIFKTVSHSTDIDTGIINSTIAFKAIRRGVLLPNYLARSIFQIEYDYRDRTILIDSKDLDTFIVEKDNWIIFNNKKYIVNSVLTFDLNEAILIIVREVKGSDVTENFEATSELALIQTISVSVV